MMNREENDLTFLVDKSGAGMRADKFLAQASEKLSRSRIQSLISDGCVFLNAKSLEIYSKKLEENDILSVRLPDVVPSDMQPENIPLDIVYEDDDLLVINKAAGMVVHPGAGNWTGTLVNALLHHCGGTLSGIGGEMRPGIVHRLDKETSGLMMVAKNDEAHQGLSAQLADRSLSRTYHALVLGVPLPIKGVVDRPIGRHRHDRQRMSVMSSAPREARTRYRVLEDFGGACALVECNLETGRTHQIRVHMQAIGYPLIGDPLYGPQPSALRSKLKKIEYSSENIDEILLLGRQFLHATRIMFIHPITGEEMGFEREKPTDLLKILKILTKNK